MTPLKSWWRNLSLSNKVVSITAAIFISMFVVLAVISFRYFSASAQSERELRARLIIDGIENYPDLDELSLESLQDARDVILQAAQSDSVDYIRIYGPNGGILLDTLEANLVDEFAHQDIRNAILESDTDYYYRHTSSNLVAGKAVTVMPDVQVVVAIQINSDASIAATTNIQRTNLVVIILTFVMGMLAVIYFTHQVTERLRSLTDATEKLALGEFSTVQVTYESKDELGSLGYTFNRMSQVISERDRELREINRTLEARVKERTEEIESVDKDLKEAITKLFAAKEKAEESNRLKTEFLTTMSHELRTPLNAIIGFTELVLSGVDGKLSDVQEKDLKRVTTSADHLLRLIDDVLDIAQIESGAISFHPKTISIVNLIEDVLPAHQLAAEKKSLILTHDIDLNMPELLFGDDYRIGQVINNLLANAIKFTSTGSVTLSVVPDENDAFFKIIVTDTGIGLDEESQKIIFEPFRQIDGSTNRQYEGIGLGLTIVERIVRIMGGKIRIKSELGKGSTFTVTLPINLDIENLKKGSNQIMKNIYNLLID